MSGTSQCNIPLVSPLIFFLVRVRFYCCCFFVFSAISYVIYVKFLCKLKAASVCVCLMYFSLLL